MFTGLVEKISKIENIAPTQKGAVISYCADFNNLKTGDSIALNGVCLTVRELARNKITCDVMKESFETTNLKYLKKGDIVNLERAMSVKSRFDGHIVQGHVDCTAQVKEIIQEGFSKRVRFFCNSDLIVKKGSITVNGVSLTVADIFDDGFCVCLIPETIEKTNLKNLQVQDIVNIEYDILAKYIKKFTTKEKKSNITEDFLKQNGF